MVDGGDLWMYERGRGVPRAPSQAVSLYQRACEGGDMLGCENLGVMYQNGGGVPQDEVRARALFQQACAGGQPSACSR